MLADLAFLTCVVLLFHHFTPKATNMNNNCSLAAPNAAERSATLSHGEPAATQQLTRFNMAAPLAIGIDGALKDLDPSRKMLNLARICDEKRHL